MFRKAIIVEQILSLLAQFTNVDAVLVAPLGGNEEGKAILKDLDNEGVNTRYCKIWKDAGIPSAWVMHAGEQDHRPLFSWY
jgi:sugar/nucleoside kinase (ribokinase family)